MCSSKIADFRIFDQFFIAWNLATSATSRGRNFNLSNLNRVSNFSSRPKLSYETLFVAQKWNWEELDYVFSIRAEYAPPPRVSRRPKSPGLLGLRRILRRTFLQFYIHSRCLMASTNQADPGCFYFRISWILMERRWFYFFHPLHFLQGLRSLKHWLLQKLSMKIFDQKFRFLIKK